MIHQSYTLNVSEPHDEMYGAQRNSISHMLCYGGAVVFMLELVHAADPGSGPGSFPEQEKISMFENSFQHVTNLINSHCICPLYSHRTPRIYIYSGTFNHKRVLILTVISGNN